MLLFALVSRVNNKTDIVLVTIGIACVLVGGAFVYLTGVRPMRGKTDEEAVGYLRKHDYASRRGANLEEYASARYAILTKGNRALGLFKIVFTIVAFLWIVVAVMFLVFVGGNSLRFTLLGLFLLACSAMLWFMNYIYSAQALLLKRYLEGQEFSE